MEMFGAAWFITTDYFDRKCFQLVIIRLNKKSISFLFYFIDENSSYCILLLFIYLSSTFNIYVAVVLCAGWCNI
jgi:hypothetical protein